MTGESLLEKVVATIVATSDAELTLTALARPEVAEPTPVAGEQTLAVWSAVLAGDAAAVREHWGAFLADVARQGILYVPLARGGDPRKIAAVRGVQQTFRGLLRRLPRLGMLRETCQLLRVARAMEKNNPQGPGAVTEFDRLFEVDTRRLSRRWWRRRAIGIRRGEGSTRANAGRAASQQSAAPHCAVDRPLAADHRVAADRVVVAQPDVVAVGAGASQHAQGLAGAGGFHSALWRDLFTQQFLHFGNLRAILHQGVDRWLERLMEDEEAAEHLQFVAELDRGLSRAEAAEASIAGDRSDRGELHGVSGLQRDDDAVGSRRDAVRVAGFSAGQSWLRADSLEYCGPW